MMGMQEKFPNNNLGDKSPVPLGFGGGRLDSDNSRKSDNEIMASPQNFNSNKNLETPKLQQDHKLLS